MENSHVLQIHTLQLVHCASVAGPQWITYDTAFTAAKLNLMRVRIHFLQDARLRANIQCTGMVSEVFDRGRHTVNEVMLLVDVLGEENAHANVQILREGAQCTIIFDLAMRIVIVSI